MSVLVSKIEATAVARFIASTHSLIADKPRSHSAWLHTLAHAYGYRDWNSLKPDLQELPVLGSSCFKSIGFHYIGFASIHCPGEETRYVVKSYRAEEGTSQELADQLAECMSRTHNFTGMQFRYTRPDYKTPPSQNTTNTEIAPPIVAYPDKGNVRIVLWWMRVLYGKPFRDTAAKGAAVYSVCFDHYAHGVTVPTDRFLQALTGIPRTPRRCVYIPLEPAPPWRHQQREAYIPLILTEGKADGEPAGWDCGLDRMEAVRRAYQINLQDGLSNLDIADIVNQHKRSEPHPNDEPEFEFYGMSED